MTALEGVEEIPLGLFLPEPTSLKAVLKLPEELKQPWFKAIYQELKSLINNKTFILGQKPRHGEQVIPIMLMFKVKQRADGFLDKLKCRAVQRGDLLFELPAEETWSPGATVLAMEPKHSPPKLHDDDEDSSHWILKVHFYKQTQLADIG
jgi:hypothetical protein